MTYKASSLVAFVHLALGLIILAMAVTPARADPADDARIKQLRLLCVQLSGDLDEPFAIMKFKRSTCSLAGLSTCSLAGRSTCSRGDRSA